MSEQNTPPAVSDALREAVARLIEPTIWTAYDEVRRQYKGIWKYTEQDCAYFADKLANTTERRARSLECADAILSGPIASEIARLIRERDAAVANAREPIGDTWDEIRRLEGECRTFIRERDEWKAVANRDLSRAEAAEAETARLRAALEDTRAAADELVPVCIAEGDTKGAGALQYVSGFISDHLADFTSQEQADA